MRQRNIRGSLSNLMNELCQMHHVISVVSHHGRTLRSTHTAVHCLVVLIYPAWVFSDISQLYHAQTTAYKLNLASEKIAWQISAEEPQCVVSIRSIVCPYNSSFHRPLKIISISIKYLIMESAVEIIFWIVSRLSTHRNEGWMNAI